MSISFRLTAAAAAALAAACAFALPAHAAGNACPKAGYSYAGIQTLAPARGLSSRVTVSQQAQVTSGHVAAWVGVGGAGMGAGGADEWLQIGISSVPGGATELYYEVTRPGAPTQYVSLKPVQAGETHRVGVYESSANAWVVWLDGAPASAPIVLPGSHDRWEPMATSESYDGGATTCNAYAFQFADIKVLAPSGAWQPVGKVTAFHDPGHSLRTLGGGSIFVRHR